MEDFKKKDKEGRNKPHLPPFPDKDKKEEKDKNDPTPESDENYQYFPGVAYPDGSRDGNYKDGENPEEKGPKGL